MHRQTKSDATAKKKKEKREKKESADSSNLLKTWSLPHLPEFIHRHENGTKSKARSYHRRKKESKSFTRGTTIRDDKSTIDTQDESKDKSNLTFKLSRFFKTRPPKQDLIEKKILVVDKSGPVIPLQTSCLCSIIRRLEELNAHLKEGIFRIPGNALLVRELWKKLGEDDHSFMEEGADSEFGPHDYAGALKLYVKEAPEPLIPFSLWSSFIEAMKIPDQSDRLLALRDVLSSLPIENFQMLRSMMIFFRKVSILSIKNKMEAKNLGIIWGPTILRKDAEDSLFSDITIINLQGQLVSTLIGSVCELFGEDIQEQLKAFEDAHREVIIQAQQDHSRAVLLVEQQNQRLREAHALNSTPQLPLNNISNGTNSPRNNAMNSPRNIPPCVNSTNGGLMTPPGGPINAGYSFNQGVSSLSQRPAVNQRPEIPKRNHSATTTITTTATTNSAPIPRPVPPPRKDSGRANFFNRTISQPALHHAEQTDNNRTVHYGNSHARSGNQELEKEKELPKQTKKKKMGSSFFSKKTELDNRGTNTSLLYTESQPVLPLGSSSSPSKKRRPFFFSISNSSLSSNSSPNPTSSSAPVTNSTSIWNTSPAAPVSSPQGPSSSIKGRVPPFAYPLPFSNGTSNGGNPHRKPNQMTSPNSCRGPTPQIPPRIKNTGKSNSGNNLNIQLLNEFKPLPT